MKINRRLLTYISSFIVSFVIYQAIMEEQWLIGSGITVVYLAFSFGADKFVIDLKNKKVEIDDESKD